MAQERNGNAEHPSLHSNFGSPPLLAHNTAIGFSGEDRCRGKGPLPFLSMGVYFLCPPITDFRHGHPQLLKYLLLTVSEFYPLFCSRGHVFTPALNATLSLSEVTSLTHWSFQAAHTHQQQRDRGVHQPNSFPRAVLKYSAQGVFWICSPWGTHHNKAIRS